MEYVYHMQDPKQALFFVQDLERESTGIPHRGVLGVDRSPHNSGSCRKIGALMAISVAMWTVPPNAEAHQAHRSRVPFDRSEKPLTIGSLKRIAEPLPS